MSTYQQVQSRYRRAIRNADKLAQEARENVEAATEEAIETIRTDVARTSEERTVMAQALQDARESLNAIRKIQIDAAQVALIGSHSEEANTERELQTTWRYFTLGLWTAAILVALVAAVLAVFDSAKFASWDYLLARSPWGAVLLTVGLAARYAGNRAEDHRIQGLVLTHLALSMRSSGHYAEAIDARGHEDSESAPGEQFLTGISETLFTSQLEVLQKRAESRWVRRPRRFKLPAQQLAED